MSRINALIVDLCPDGVESKPLGELGEFIRGNGLQKKDLFDSGVPAIHYGQIHTTYGVATKESVSFTSPEIAERLRHAKPGDLLIATTSEDDEAVAKATAWLGESDVALSGDAFIYRHRLEPRYVSYFFQSEHFQVQKQRYISGAKVRRISGKSLEKVQIPVPPLEVQLEIVKILDKFTQLEAELEAELEARKFQYDFYAEKLLSVEADVPVVKFGDVATITRGASPRPIRRFLTEEASGVPWIKIGDVPTDGKYITDTAQKITLVGAKKSRRVKQGDFVLSNSMSFGRPYISKIEGYIHDGWLAISDFEETFNRDYLFYLLRSAAIQDEFARKAGAGTVKNLNAEIVRSIVIPAPSLESQQRIVASLNQFDALVNDISVGLPAEITARRQQYEFYRDKLLTFRELEAAS